MWRSVYLFCGCALLTISCSRSNNLLMGRVEAKVGDHQAVVTDCYRTSVPQPVQVEPAVYRFTPCRDADILVSKDELIVNGKSYGQLQPRDVIVVDHSVVSVQRP
jgi:hypothetical protein